jgi:hypothetical protein
LRRNVLGLVADRINENAAAHRAVGTRRARLCSARNLQFFQLGVSGLEVKSEDGGGDAADRSYLEEVSPGRLHAHITSRSAQNQ